MRSDRTPLDGRAIGRVVESRILHLVRGDLVLHCKGWRTHELVRAGDIQVLPQVPGVPISAYLGIFGGTGFTAYAALTRIAHLRAGLIFLLRPTRDAEATTHFFLKVLHSTADGTPQSHPVEEQITQRATASHPDTSVPRVINVDKNAAYPKAILDLKAAGILPEHVELRQVKYLNNLIEQDHRFIKRLTKPGMGFFSFETAWQPYKSTK